MIVINYRACCLPKWIMLVAIWRCEDTSKTPRKSEAQNVITIYTSAGHASIPHHDLRQQQRRDSSTTFVPGCPVAAHTKMIDGHPLILNQRTPWWLWSRVSARLIMLAILQQLWAAEKIIRMEFESMRGDLNSFDFSLSCCQNNGKQSPMKLTAHARPQNEDLKDVVQNGAFWGQPFKSTCARGRSAIKWFPMTSTWLCDV